MSDTQDTEAITQETMEEYERRVIAAFNPESAISYAPLKSITILKGHAGPVYAIAVAQDGKTIVSGNINHEICRWDMESGMQIGATIRTHQHHFTHDLDILPDGKTIVYNDANKTAIIRRNIENGREIEPSLNGLACDIHGFAISPDGSRIIASASPTDDALTRTPYHGIPCRVVGKDGDPRKYAIAIYEFGKT